MVLTDKTKFEVDVSIRTVLGLSVRANFSNTDKKCAVKSELNQEKMT